MPTGRIANQAVCAVPHRGSRRGPGACCHGDLEAACATRVREAVENIRSFFPGEAAGGAGSRRPHGHHDGGKVLGYRRGPDKQQIAEYLRSDHWSSLTLAARRLSVRCRAGGHQSYVRQVPLPGWRDASRRLALCAMPSLFVPNGFLSAFELESHDAEAAAPFLPPSKSPEPRGRRSATSSASISAPPTVPWRSASTRNPSTRPSSVDGHQDLPR
jgi:hypothetical protein